MLVGVIVVVLSVLALVDWAEGVLGVDGISSP